MPTRTPTPRLLALLILFALSLSLPAPSTSPPIAGIAHVALRVKDLAASKAFYESLGFLQAFDLERDGVPYESFIKINDHQFIELYPVSPKDPQPGFLHLCFEGDDLQALHDFYTSNGLKPIDVRTAAAGNLLFTMPGPLQPIGPAGKPIPQNIEYTQYMPGSKHSNDVGQHLGPERIADRLLGVGLAMQDPAAAQDFYLNDLSFKPLPGHQMTMHLPGNSGEQIQILPATALGTHAFITFETQNLARAARHLNHEHIKFQKFPEDLSFQDPDNNQLLIQQR